MKWNIILVVFFVLLMGIRILINNEDSHGSEDNQEQIMITPIVIKKSIPENDRNDREKNPFESVEKDKTIIENKKSIESNYTKIEKSEKRKEEQKGALQVSMHSSRPFVNEQSKFHPSDKIYVSLVFPTLKAGQYNIVTHWKAPWGIVARKIVRKIELYEDTKDYRVHFWFQLVENSALTKMFTGADYQSRVYGNWKVLLYVNEEHIVTKSFVMADT